MAGRFGRDDPDIVFEHSKSLIQAAALPFAVTRAGVLVALITSRRQKRWIVPKGWPDNDRQLCDVAAREAREEAGIVGAISGEPVGSFDYLKLTDAGYRISCRVFVFPLAAEYQLLDWEERDVRRVRWRPIAKAADIVSDKGLARLMHDIAASPDRLGSMVVTDKNRTAG